MALARTSIGPHSGTYVPVGRVDVYLWGQHIGAVALDPTYGFYSFNYTPEFRATDIQPAPLEMRSTTPGPYIFPQLDTVTWKRLPAMLADALPDDFGNALIDSYMAEKGIAKESVTALDRLAYMGTRSMGALTFRPARGPRFKQATPIEMSDLVEKARMAVRGTFAEDSSTTLQHIIDVGTSAGGARAKAVITWNPETMDVRSGQFDAPEGFEHWLLKFDGMGPDLDLGKGENYGRIEYAYYLMARAVGIQMMPSRLLEEGGRAHFMTRRFDRAAGNVRHHMATLCAMDHLNYKLKATNAYSQLFLVMGRLNLEYADRAEAFTRMAFNVMARNCDDHSKNFSFLLRQGEPWTLAPAYDVTYAYNPSGEWTYQHLMSVNGKFQDISQSDLLEEANRFSIGGARSIIESIRAVLHRWPEFAEQASVPFDKAEDIGREHLLLNN